MNPAHDDPRSLPRYSARDDEKTRPCIVLFDWDGDEEATVRVKPVDPSPRTAPSDVDDDIDVNQYGPHWRGIGRRPGAVALALVLGLSVTIGLFALLAPNEAQAEAAGASFVSTP